MANLLNICRILSISLAIFLWGVLDIQGTALARQEHIVYFRDTPYELNIYKIRGRNRRADDDDRRWHSKAMNPVVFFRPTYI